ncbi:S60 ribosomal protein L28 [Cavenderia fasciculata]|uniref:S60 ribosomal protein L28 n=1 Tax=Cavenderia fasciculata TaxID=261658 RepID=F4QDP2_CACFS|nr:S60 ribosomal protein L28 [Cavenderia fasciculata]EGG13839.1 S60 ribosomal protein L28 [Cavenderia fasciculata]|eukprot:XP_004350547.1 S60 ribosomal protein L28 [Cavenderia fasciculata]
MSDRKVIHPLSRKAKYLAKEGFREMHKKNQKEDRNKKNHIMYHKVNWFKEHMIADKKQYTERDMSRLIEQFIKRNDAELGDIDREHKNVNRSNKLDILISLRDSELKQFHGEGVTAPDLTKIKNVQWLKQWDGNVAVISQQVTFKKFKSVEEKDDEIVPKPETETTTTTTTTNDQDKIQEHYNKLVFLVRDHLQKREASIYRVLIGEMSDLIFQIVKHNHAFRKVSNGKVLSAEPGNLRNVNSVKHSAFARSKNIDITTDKNGKVVVAIKSKASKVSPAKAFTKIPTNTSSYRATAKTIKNLVREYKTPELRFSALGRFHRLFKASRNAAANKKAATIAAKN